MSISNNKEETIIQIKGLISTFKKQQEYFKSYEYNESQMRNDFLNPFLQALGWDVNNQKGKSQFLRDVIQEESIDIGDGNLGAKKKPDYTLRVDGYRKLFIEAKKPFINIETSKDSAFQIRRYGWSANLGISILTNFQTLVIYDCRYKPLKEDLSNVARYKIFRMEDYIAEIDDLIQLLGFESVSSGYIDEFFGLSENETTPFDSYFLCQIESWRKILASNIQKNNKSIDAENINFLSQRLLNRIIFLRICEDREIEKYEILKNISSYDELKKIFRASDQKYNSNLFDFIDDKLSMNINLDKQILIDIFKELYYPISPYNFAVIDPLILSQIYEQYLGSKVSLLPSSEIEIIQEPEVIESNGVVPTPKLIANEIVEETLQSLLEGKSLDEIKDIKIADICCGSGTFLITLYDYLVKENLNILLKQDTIDNTLIYEKENGTKYLTLNKKREILTKNIFGVDINPYAVEVTRFSLLLKLLEDEDDVTIKHYLETHNKVLPNLDENIKFGNSLIDNTFYDYDNSAIENDELVDKINPFNWVDEFPFLQQNQGFDAIIGNPPYLRIQSLVKYFSEEINYYKSSSSPYSVCENDNFDKYYLFIEKAIELINSNGVIGYIVPHKFFVIKGGKKLRLRITSKCSFSKIIHFGVTQVFPGRQNYTTIIIFGKQKKDKFTVKRITNFINKSSFSSAKANEYEQNKYSDSPWLFLSKKAEILFERVEKSNNIVLLKNIAKILVGLQTSCDKVYILHLIRDNGKTVIVRNDDKTNQMEFEIEKEVILPCLYDFQLNLFDTPKPNSYIIFPYLINENRASVYSEDHMESYFPFCWQYLNRYKTKLSNRNFNENNPKWYQYGRSQNLTNFHNIEKLIWKVLSKEASYTYDDSNIQFTGGGNGPYYALTSRGQYSILYILAILSHPLIEAMVKSKASEFRGGFYSHGKQFIQDLPIRAIDFNSDKDIKIYNELVKITQNILKVKEEINTIHKIHKKPILLRKYDILRKSQIESINLLYNISEKEILEIEGDKLFFAELLDEENYLCLKLQRQFITKN